MVKKSNRIAISLQAKIHTEHPSIDKKGDLERRQKTLEGKEESGKSDYSAANKDTHVRSRQ